jgi:hypothetical protein
MTKGRCYVHSGEAQQTWRCEVVTVNISGNEQSGAMVTSQGATGHSSVPVERQNLNLIMRRHWAIQTGDTT